MQEKENVLKILEGVKQAIKKEDSIALRNLSNQTNNTASRTQDPDNITIAVIVYSLSKMVERGRYRTDAKLNDFYNLVISLLNNSAIAVKKNDEAKLKENLEGIRKAIDKLSVNLKKYIQDVFRKARINKASKIYGHGISMEKTASLLGITMFELANYVGERGTSEFTTSKTSDAKSRVKLAMEMFA